MLKLKKRWSGKDKKDWAYQIAGTCPFTGAPVRKGTRTRDRGVAEALLKKRLDAGRDRIMLGDATGSITFAKAVLNYAHEKGDKDETFIAPMLERWARTAIKDITDQELIDFTTDHYPGRKNSTILRQVYAPFSAIWNKQVELGLAQPRNFSKPKADPVETAYARNDDVIFEVLRNLTRFEYQVCTLFMSFTGTRVGKAVALKVKQYDPDLAQIDLGLTKNGKPQMVVLTPRLNEEMRKLDLRDGESLLFGIPSRWTIYKALRRASDRLELGDRLTPHRIGRHTFAARFLRLGNSLKALQQAGNWNSINAVMRYSHLEQHSVHDAVRSQTTTINELPRPLLITRSPASVQKVCNKTTQKHTNASNNGHPDASSGTL